MWRPYPRRQSRSDRQSVERRKAGAPPISGVFGKCTSQPALHSPLEQKRERSNRKNKEKKMERDGWVGNLRSFPEKHQFRCAIYFTPSHGRTCLLLRDGFLPFFFFRLVGITPLVLFFCCCVYCVGKKKVVGDISNISFWNIATVHDLKCGCIRRHRCEEAGGEKKFDTWYHILGKFCTCVQNRQDWPTDQFCHNKSTFPQWKNVNFTSQYKGKMTLEGNVFIDLLIHKSIHCHWEEIRAPLRNREKNKMTVASLQKYLFNKMPTVS